MDAGSRFAALSKNLEGMPQRTHSISVSNGILQCEQCTLLKLNHVSTVTANEVIVVRLSCSQFIRRAITLETMLDNNAASRQEVKRRVHCGARDFVTVSVHVHVKLVCSKVRSNSAARSSTRKRSCVLRYIFVRRKVRNCSRSCSMSGISASSALCD